MTVEDRDLLYKDICGRIPYGTKYGTKSSDYKPIGRVSLDSYTKRYISHDDLKPFLRKLSTMTKEEKKEYICLSDLITVDGVLVSSYETFDWLNAHHFDYRGLIEKGEAIEAPEDMY